MARCNRRLRRGAQALRGVLVSLARRYQSREVAVLNSSRTTLGNTRRRGPDVLSIEKAAGLPTDCQSYTARYATARCALTLVEMLVAMALTLVMMTAVVSIFANVSKSVTNRRATIEMADSVRQARGLLQRDLAGATCPGIPWQRPDSSHGYIELIEGPASDFNPSMWLQDTDDNGEPDAIAGLQLDLVASALPSSNLGILPGATTSVTDFDENAVTDGRALGDHDDILMLTVRNEDEPFVGRYPTNTQSAAGFYGWGNGTLQSPLAEVIWFSVENPVEPEDAPTFYFGEPGFRTVYRRALLIAPHLDYQFNVNGAITGPGVLRVINGVPNTPDGLRSALAALVAFQERYDISARVEWNPALDGGRWTIVANSLADLTKRENRYDHHGYFHTATSSRRFPFVATSSGAYGGDFALAMVGDPESSPTAATASARVVGGSALLYEVADGGLYAEDNGTQTTTDDTYFGRPFVWANIELAPAAPSAAHATPRAIVNEAGQVVGITNGLVPLGGPRRGEDVVLQNTLAFDLRLYDAKAPLVAEIQASTSTDFPGTILAPGDEGWGRVVQRDLSSTTLPTTIGRGGYVDLGYYRLHQAFFGANSSALGNWPTFSSPAEELSQAGVALLDGSVLSDRPHLKAQMRPIAGSIIDSYRTYCTWSLHYEHNGINEDNDTIARYDPVNPQTLIVEPYVDEGTDGLDVPTDDVVLPNGLTTADPGVLGPDDLTERETSPPYDVRLRGIQATIRAYELDSRQVREVKVSQTFVPK